MLSIVEIVLTQAIQNFVLKLKCHLLPRIVAVHAQGSGFHQDCDPNLSLTAGLDDSFNTLDANPGDVILKNDRIYQHFILRINYTTYDIRRAEDILNPNSEHRDILMLHRQDSEHDRSLFYYARIIGVYHANVQYIGPGMRDYSPRRIDFLHVRWLERVPQRDLCGLEALRFVETNDLGSFDFVDPADVLRGCHLLPAFRHGKLHGELHRELSPIARDSEDWKYYYVNK